MLRIFSERVVQLIEGRRLRSGLTRDNIVERLVLCARALLTLVLLCRLFLRGRSLSKPRNNPKHNHDNQRKMPFHASIPIQRGTRGCWC